MPMSNQTTPRRIGQRRLGSLAIAALREFPLPDQSAAVLDNYRRILDWLYCDEDGHAGLIVECQNER